MARKHYWQFLVTDEGNPIENASITIYEAGSENPVWVYTDEIGGTGTASAPQVTTSKKGFFEFWVATNDEANGYPITTKFKIAWSAPGVSGGYIDYVDVFSTAVAPVLIGDSNPDLNKAVSNALATGWELHKNWTIAIDGHGVHGLYGVDVGDTDPVLSKLVSNFYAKRWTDHESTDYTGATDIFAPPTNPHGIEQGDATFVSTDTTVNKLVADSWTKNWESHRLDLSDDHLQYSRVDGFRDFTNPVGYDQNYDITTELTDTEFVTKFNVQQKRADFWIGKTDGSNVGADLMWTNIGGGIFEALLVHNKGISYPAMGIWDYDTAQLISPYEVTIINPNTIRVRHTVDESLYVRMIW